MIRTFLFAVLSCAAVTVFAPHAHAQDADLDPATVAQLHRLEPLSDAIIKAFTDAGKLTAAQADYVREHLTADGKLNIAGAAPAPAPAPVPAAPQPAPAPAPRPLPANPPPAAAPPAAPAPAESDVYSQFHYTLPAADQEHLRTLIRDYRHGDHDGIGAELKKHRPQVNQLIAQYYKDPIDLPIKVDLWESVTSAINPDACLGIFETYSVLYTTAKPILIAYEKDIGGVLVRRKRAGPEANDAPAERFITSREFRDMIETTEGLIAHCNGPTAALYLMDIYAQRYGDGEAPLRDSNRDRRRMVEVCGGSKKKFDEDEPKTWSSNLSQHDRAVIAEGLIPWLHRDNGDRRQIARNGLMICLPHHHPDWKAGKGEWARWWQENKAALLAEK
jgi:hypothetical protein